MEENNCLWTDAEINCLPHELTAQLAVKMMDLHISCFHVGKLLHQRSNDVGINVVMAHTSLPKQLMQIGW